MKKGLYYTLLVILIGAFVFSAFSLGRYFYQSKKEQSVYDELAKLVTDDIAETETGTFREPESEPVIPDVSDDVPEQTEEAKEKPILGKYSAIYQLNQDTVGWMRIPETKVNYPVVQTPDDPNHYLHLNFEEEYASSGCLYLQENCDMELPSDNLIVYGHNMKNGTMFGQLDKFENKSFWEDHRTFTFDSLREKRTYEIFAVFTMSVSDTPDLFRYHKFVNAASAEEFDQFISRCRDYALYDTGIRPVYGDKLLTLSTCEYTHANGRLVLVARQVS